MRGALHTKAGYRVLFPIVQALPLYPIVSHSTQSIEARSQYVQYLPVPGFGLGSGGSLRPGLVFCGGGGGGVVFLLVSAVSPLGVVSSSILPPQLD